MLIADDIFETLWNAKTYYLEFTSKILEKKTYGDNVECDENKMIALSNWIRILEEYFYSLEDGNIPEESYWTYDQMSELMAKMNAAIDLKLPNTNTFRLQSGQLQDEAFWNDSLFISDEITFS